MGLLDFLEEVKWFFEDIFDTSSGSYSSSSGSSSYESELKAEIALLEEKKEIKKEEVKAYKRTHIDKFLPNDITNSNSKYTKGYSAVLLNRNDVEVINSRVLQDIADKRSQAINAETASEKNTRAKILDAIRELKTVKTATEKSLKNQTSKETTQKDTRTEAVKKTAPVKKATASKTSVKKTEPQQKDSIQRVGGILNEFVEKNRAYQEQEEQKRKEAMRDFMRVLEQINNDRRK